VARVQYGIVVLLVVFGLLTLALLVMAGRRRQPRHGVHDEAADRTLIEDAHPASASADMAPAPVRAPVDRRMFLNRTMLGSLSLFAIAMGAGSAAFIWPSVRPGRFGSRIVAGRLDAVLDELDLSGRPIYHREGKFYLTRYEGNATDHYTRSGVLAAGLMAIYQKCSHLGCRVPYCPTSGWFECPCHGAMFNGAGEVKAGPAPAGLWRFAIEIVNGEVVVDTSSPIAQTPWGFDSIGTPPRSAHCISD
jgi:cytochrome b6-f complex iron-sulfur subunit